MHGNQCYYYHNQTNWVLQFPIISSYQTYHILRFLILFVLSLIKSSTSQKKDRECFFLMLTQIINVYSYLLLITPFHIISSSPFLDEAIIRHKKILSTNFFLFMMFNHRHYIRKNKLQYNYI